MRTATHTASTQDLDELHAAYVEPVVARVGELAAHRKFVDAARDAVRGGGFTVVFFLLLGRGAED